jgi:hypothetical protein
VSRQLEDRHLEDVEDCADQGELGAEGGGGLGASRLVVRELRGALERRSQIEAGRQEVRSLLLKQLDEHRGETIDGVRVCAVGGLQVLGECVESTKRKRMAVEQ